MLAHGRGQPLPGDINIVRNIASQSDMRRATKRYLPHLAASPAPEMTLVLVGGGISLASHDGALKTLAACHKLGSWLPAHTLACGTPSIGGGAWVQQQDRDTRVSARPAPEL